MGRHKNSHKAHLTSVDHARQVKKIKREEIKRTRQEVNLVLRELVDTIATEEEDAEIHEEVQNEAIDEYHNDPDFYNLTEKEDSNGKTLQNGFLVWNIAAKTDFCLRGESRRNRFLKRKEVNDREQSVAKCRKLDHYFPRTASAESVVGQVSKADDTPNSQTLRFTTYQEAIDSLIPVTEVTTNKSWDNDVKARLSLFRFNQLKALRDYFTRLHNGEGKYAASAKVAHSHFNTDSENANCYRARCVRHWGVQYLMFGCIIQSRQGKHIKTTSVIGDENFQLRLKEVLRAMPEVRRIPRNFMTLLNNDILKEFLNAPTRISEITARRWMKILGYKMVNVRKDYYVDGHERNDVVEYRQIFLQRMEEIETRMNIFKPKDTVFEGKNIVFITHDETTCYSNDATRMVWRDPDREGIMRPKGNGKSIMISGFACACHGFIRIESQKSYTTIRPGKNDDGYWTNDDLVKQLDDVMPLFEQYHPDCDLIFAFDNSQNHHAMAPDALVASRLNKSDGGKNVPFLRDGWYHDTNGNKVLQNMKGPDGRQKGIESILKERNLWPEDKFNLDCPKGCPQGSTNCCARKLLANQPDFLAQKCWLEEVASKKSHQIIFYPKFHCELNFIEMVWGYMKAKLRFLCTFNFQDLCDNVPLLLDNIDPTLIIKFVKHCFRFMQGYRVGLHGPVLDYAMKKYKSHRCIPNTATYQDLQNEMKAEIKRK